MTDETNLPPFDDPKYREALDGDLTDEQARELLAALDFILRGFVDLGFGVDALQLAIPELAKFCESPEGLTDFSGTEDSKDVRMEGYIETFNSAAHNLPQKD
jgi:hypothetical protein